MNLDQLDNELKSLLKQVGAYTKYEFERFSHSKIEYKGLNDPFTYVDVTTEQKLVARCKELIPGSGFINEEGDNVESTNGAVWIIDPIDGTTNFIHGIPHYAISLALEIEGELTLGYVYEPAHDQLFSARKGHGAFLNDRPIHVTDHSDLSKAVIATGFPYEDLPWRGAYVSAVSDIQAAAHGIRRMGSAALDLAFVAAGRYEGFFEYNLNPWDVAAGILLVHEAGGKVTDFQEKDRALYGKQLVASNGQVHGQILDILRKHRVPEHDIQGNP
ncbi:inositol monophosphatase family protein [Pontibacter sp. G13]|uniref:inositol monophosphatase family protein n=1 Tax=Pontibacter sp. G13 TaxID=3074898 RepID=UPI002889C380|nr:inositol monophosphatase family protein [Pontibacter sp. G13]WNJ16277.1 inositol monophosphatase family protein [Pontibacter sp. G13]